MSRITLLLIIVSFVGVAEGYWWSEETTCETVATTDGECCVFPFIYNGKTYKTCTTDGPGGDSWCATTANYDQDKKYGYCEFKTCDVKTFEGECCVFPFWYLGVRHYGCTTAASVGKPWCGTQTYVISFTGGHGRCLIDPCDNAPCKNGGTCTSGDDKFTCKCPWGFEGPTCEAKVNPCDRSPCRKGTVCKQNDDNFLCLCSGGFNGENCDKKVCDGLATTDGGCCTFPFTYDGKEYSACTTEGLGTSWCSTTSNFDTDYKWGFCNALSGSS